MLSPRSRQRGLATLFVVVTLLAISSLVLLASSKHLVVDQFNAQNQHRYHQALNYAETGLETAIATLVAGGTPANGSTYSVTLQDAGTGIKRLVVTGLYDGQQVAVQRLVRITSGGGGGSTLSALTLIGNLDMGGNVTILGGKSAVLTVDGNVTLGGSVSGIDSLLATGSISVRGNQTVNNLQANGDIDISNGTYRTIKTMGNILMSGNAVAADLVKANGTGTFSNNNVANAEIIGHVTINGGGTSMGPLKTQGNLTSSTSGAVGPVQAQGNLTISGWGGAMTATIGGTASYNTSNTNIKVTRVSGLKVPIDPVTEVKVSQNKINAYDYRAQANYAFTLDASNNIIVTVANVSGLSDGAYRIGTNASNDRNYLCKTVDSKGACATGQTMVKFCEGFSSKNDCLSVSNSRAWTLNGNTVAPGILWFEGNVTIGNRYYLNTVIATGNIDTSANLQLYAPNYAGYADVCANTTFSLRPVNLCDFSTGKLRGLSTGNIAFLSGGYQGSSYVGGNISLGAKNEVFGSVIAGNQLNSTGNTTVHGYITAGRCDSLSDGRCVKPAGLQGHTWRGNTTIDLRNLPTGFDPGNTGTGTGSGGSGGNTVTTIAASWIDSGSTP